MRGRCGCAQATVGLGGPVSSSFVASTSNRLATQRRSKPIFGPPTLFESTGARGPFPWRGVPRDPRYQTVQDDARSSSPISPGILRRGPGPCADAGSIRPIGYAADRRQGLAGELAVYSMVQAKSLAKVEDALEKETAEWLKPDYFSKTQLDDVRRQLIVGHKFELNKPSDYAKTLAFWWGTTGMDYLSGYIPAMEKVTIPDIQKFVRKYFVGAPHMTTVLINTKEAQAAGIADTSKPIMEKLLKNY